MVEYVELADPPRVLRLEITPDGPGYMGRTWSVVVESGPLLTAAEADRILGRVIAELVSRGADHIRWAVNEEDPEGEDRRHDH